MCYSLLFGHTDPVSKETGIQLVHHTVHLWKIPFNADEATAVLPLLTDDEVNRSDTFRFDRDRLAFIHARGSLRALLGRYLQLPPEKVVFDYQPDGKPMLQGHDSGPDIQFNLSHTQGLAAIAMTSGMEVGVDVERVRPVQERDSISASHFTSQERSLFGPAHSDEAFCGCWTRKEAALKAIGKGLMRPLDTFGVVADDQRQHDRFRVVGDFPNASQWCVHSFKIEPNYVGAVAVPSDQSNLVIFNWDP